MSDYENMVWEIYATDNSGDRVYCGNCDYERGADALITALCDIGFTDIEKKQTLRGNAGQTLLKRFL